jgi:hypothetical protein
MNRLRFVRAALGAVLIGLLVHLLVGEKPWEPDALARFHSGKARPIDLARIYRWWISLANAGLVAGLWLTAPRWLGPREAPVDPALAPPPARLPGFALLVGGAIACAAALAWPRLEFSFWDDEAYTVFHYIGGGYEHDPETGLERRTVKLRDALLYTKWPNNHVPNTLLARLSLAAHRALAKPELEFADERAVRLPAYAAGLAAIGAAAALLRRLGWPAGGVFCAWLLALHPWQLRYISEARGYALVLLFVPLLLHTAVAAFERATWRRWLAFTFAGAFILWTYPGAVSVVAVANLAVGAALLGAGLRERAGRTRATRWVVSNLVAAGVFAQLMLANLFIFLFHTPWSGDELDTRFVRDVVSHVWVGTAWQYRRFHEHYAELADFAAAWPIAFHAALAATLALVALGAARLVARGRLHAGLAATLLLPAPVTLAAAVWRQTLFHEWYVIFALPSLAILLAIGLETSFAPLGAGRARRAVAAAAMAAYLFSYAALSHGAREALRAGSIQPTREVVALMRPVRDPRDPANQRILTAGWITWYYDPLVQRVDDVEALMAESDASGKPLFVSYSRPELARRRLPRLVELVEDPARFELVERQYGFEPRGHVVVYRYRGAAATPAPGEDTRRP